MVHEILAFSFVFNRSIIENFPSFETGVSPKASKLIFPSRQMFFIHTYSCYFSVIIAMLMANIIRGGSLPSTSTI